LLQIARQPTEKKMIEMFHRIMQGGLTRDEARRDAEKSSQDRSGHSRSSFNSSHRGNVQVPDSVQEESCSRDELISTLRQILAQLEGSSSEADSTAA